jgi:hypothetical protein
MGSRFCSPLLVLLAVGETACGSQAIEGVYGDRSRIVANTCGPIAQAATPRATVSIDDDGALAINLSDIHFEDPGDGGIAVPAGRTTVIVGDEASDVTEVGFCGILPLDEEVVSAAISGAGSTPAPTPAAPGFIRMEALERLSAGDNIVRIRQTLRFADVDVCPSVRLTTVPPRDCEVTRAIELVLLQACPADCQRIQPLRGDDAVFCLCEEP